LVAAVVPLLIFWGGSVRIFTRILAAVAIAAFSAGPVSAAAAGAPVNVAQSATGATIGGAVHSDSGASIGAVRVMLRGPSTYSTTTDANGNFSIANVVPGIYTLSAERAGYSQATEQDFVVVAGQTQNVAITLQTATFSALHTIAVVRSVGRGAFNTTPAAVSTVSQQDFVNQGAIGLNDVLNEVPGLQVSLSSEDTNGAAPGAINYANIRDGLSFETATLIDGHPLSVGRYGDYVLTFWTPYVFQSAEVVKGPGAEATQTNYAINGTLNLRTLDPTQEAESEFVAGYMSYGGTFFNVRYSATEGRLGFVADVAETDQESPLDNINVQLANTTGGYFPNGTNIGYNDNLSQVPGTNAYAYNNFSLMTCCYTVSGYLTRLNELFKVRYRFSNSTVATVSYLGNQGTSDENGDVLQMLPSVFQPGAGYSGPVPVGQTFLASNVYPAADVETNNEPIFQAEVTSALGNDTVLARYYHANIDRFIQQGNSNPDVPNVEYDTFNGTSGGAVYNNVTYPIDWYEYFVESEDDSLNGLDLQYSHPYGDGNAVTASYSHTYSTTSYYEAEADTDNYPDVTAGVPDVTIPQGTTSIFNTYRLSDTQNFGDKFNARLSLYENQYAFTSASTCGTGASYTSSTACELSGANATFHTQTPTHFDERLGLTYRPASNLVFRASAGSSIAPPYANLLSKFSEEPSCSTPPCTTPLLVTFNNPNLRPETSFGYDLGSDYRYKQNYFLSTDVYLTNLFNQFITTTSYAGLCTSQAYPGSGCGAAGSGVNTPPVFYSINDNVNNARYEGIEVTLKHVVQNGIGWLVQGSTQRGYAYDLGSSFYCNFAPTAKEPCTPAYYDQNLGVVAGQNFTGGGSGTYYIHAASCAATDYYCVEDGAAGVSNQSVPYLQGYAEINWQTTSGWYASFGETLFGKNNSYNEPPFVIARATLRIPLNDRLSLQFSGNNIFNEYNGFFPIVGAGVGVPLANGGVVPSLGNVYGPATYSAALKVMIGGAH
jgi:outer membrane receptor protein involved in Fe transport